MINLMVEKMLVNRIIIYGLHSRKDRKKSVKKYILVYEKHFGIYYCSSYL